MFREAVVEKTEIKTNFGALKFDFKLGLLPLNHTKIAIFSTKCF